MWSIARRGLSATVMLLSLMIGLAPGSSLDAQSKRLEIERFHAEITVAESGRAHISEAIRFRFTGSWNGIYRDIPVVYRTPAGFNHNLVLDVQSVTGGDGQSLRFEESRHRHYRRIKVWVPNATDAVHTVHIQYTVPNALRFIDPKESEFEAGHDEL